MGVQGLGKYLRDNHRSLAETLVAQKDAAPISIVVDGWSFIYALYFDSHLPWVYGGEYVDFSRHVRSVVEAWIRVSLKVYFVFDGPYPSLKFLTAKLRMEESIIKPSLLFFRTSAASRVQPRIIPPLIYANTIQALKELEGSSENLQIHFADEEGDPYAVELAGRLGAYVVGNDSDFMILNSEGYRGYIPLEDMTWVTSTPQDSSHQGDEFGFTPAKVKRKAMAKPTRGLLPPEDEGSICSLSMTAYIPSSFSSHLGVPISLFPLFGALVGNDYSNQSPLPRQSVQLLFFERQSTATQRIERVASTLRSILTASSAKKHRPKHQIGSVMDLIDRAVNSLLLRSSSMGSAEIDSVIDRVVDSTLQYAIPKHEGVQGLEGLWATDFCALHPPDICPLLPIISRNISALAEESDDEDSDALKERNQIRAAYLDAYRDGHLAPRILDILSTGTYWPRLPLEHPDMETVAMSIGSRIRAYGYAILEDALGLPSTPSEGLGLEGSEVQSNASIQGDPEEDSDDDELVDVVEEDSDDDFELSSRLDPLAPLKGALQELHAPGSGASTRPASVSASGHTSLRPSASTTVVEYIRRGTHVSEERVLVPLLGDILSAEIGGSTDSPLLLRPEPDRFKLFLKLLKSDLPTIHPLPGHVLLPLLAVRWVIMSLHARAQAAPSQHRQLELWTPREAQCVLAGLLDNNSMVSDEQPPIVDRHIQLVAQTSMALESIVHLAQIMLIPQRFPMTALKFSGARIHSLLASNRVPNVMGSLSDIWTACVVGLEDDVFGEDRRPKSKKAKKIQLVSEPVAKSNGRATGGLFSMLSMETV
ncbi:hypothetical protein ONZ45_g8886 [Pleurotus djamor]|nr:hypothetical protein ONZ45_g8886 [Pleurotus djamor]